MQKNSLLAAVRRTICTVFPYRLDYLDFEKIIGAALNSLKSINIVIPAQAGI